MRTSHVKMKRLINDAKQTITDEALFGSNQFMAYLMDIAEAVSKRYKRPVKIEVQWNPESKEIAYTDNRSIVINSANSLTAMLPIRAQKADSLVGLLAHELGHVNYTCFAIMQTYFRTLSTGKFKPALTGLNKKEKEAKAALEKFFSEGNKVAVAVIEKAARRLHNTIEDAYIEARISHDFPGRFAYGIRLNNQLMFQDSLSLKEQLDQGHLNLVIIENLLLEYCLTGTVKNPEQVKGKLWDTIIVCAPIIDDAKYDDDIRNRLKAASRILLKLWPYVEEAIEKFEQEQSDKQSNDVGGNSADQSEDDQELEEAIKEFLNNGLERMSQEPVGQENGVELKEKLEGSQESSAMGEKEEDNKNQLETEQASQPMENPPRIPLEHTDAVEDGDNGGIEHNRYFADNGYSTSAHEIEKLLTQIGSEMVCKKEEAALSEELQAESDRIDYGNAHRGIKMQVNRMINVPENLIWQYQQVAPALNVIALQLVKQVKAVLPKESGGIKHSYMGKRLEPRTLIHKDGKYFKQEKLPQEPGRLAVSLVVDESGSMKGERIAAARAASIILYQFCQMMKIPISVIGHTELYDVKLYSYADFDSVDNKDCYRLMDIRARANNRDGAALRYAAERLTHQPESKKLLIILSDGEPCGIGYIGTAAEADIRGIVQEYTRKGITFFAGAIGDDKPNIERIYKKGYLDMSDLKKLPQNLARLIQQYLI